jgi:hypothetical protein
MREEAFFYRSSAKEPAPLLANWSIRNPPQYVQPAYSAAIAGR